MKQHLQKYFLIVLSLFDLPMQGSFIKNSQQQSAINEIVQYATSKKDYKSLASVLKKFQGINETYVPDLTYEGLADDLNDMYDDSDDQYKPTTILDHIAWKIGEGVFDLNILQLLYQYGADKNNLYNILHNRTLRKKEKSFLHKIFATTRMINSGGNSINIDISLMEFFIEKTKNNHLINYFSEGEGETLLTSFIKFVVESEYHLPRLYGQKKKFINNVLRLLFKKGANPNETLLTKEATKSTPFHEVCYRQLSDQFDLFFEYGADPNAQDYGTTPTQLAFMCHYIKSIDSSVYLDETREYITEVKFMTRCVPVQFILHGADMYEGGHCYDIPMKILESKANIGIQLLLSRFEIVVEYYIREYTTQFNHISIHHVYLDTIYQLILHPKMYQQLLITQEALKKQPQQKLLTTEQEFQEKNKQLEKQLAIPQNQKKRFFCYKDQSFSILNCVFL